MTKRDKIVLVYTGLWAIIFVFCIWSGIHLRNQLDEHKKLLKIANNELFTAQQDLGEEMKKVLELNETLDLMSANLDKANETIALLKSKKYELMYLGDFKITYYCDERYNHICGGSGLTASGKATEVGWTAAADWDVLPNGSIVYIDGIGFREIQDVGGAVNDCHIDVLVQEHATALANGVDCEGVWLLIQKES